MEQKMKETLVKAGKELLFEILKLVGQKIVTTASSLQNENERKIMARPAYRNFEDLKFKYETRDKETSE